MAQGCAGVASKRDWPHESRSLVSEIREFGCGTGSTAIAKVHKMLRPGGIFVSSTVCLTGRMKFLKVIVPIGKALGFMPSVRFFAAQELLDSLTDAGFEIDHHWLPGKGNVVFIVAKKATS